MPTRKGIQAGASYPLDDHWVDRGDQPFHPTAEYPIPLRVAPSLLPTADGKLWPRSFGWPLTLDESRRLSPTEALQRAEEERTKPTPQKWRTWFLMRCRDVMATAPDLDTQHRLMKDAYVDLLSALANAHLRQSREHVVRSKKGADKSAETRQGKAKGWQTQALAEWDKMKKENPTRTARFTNAVLAERIRFRLIDATQWSEDKPPKEVALRLFIGEERWKEHQNKQGNQRQSD